MTKTAITLLLCFAAIFAMAAPAFALDPDLNAMTPDELQAYIQALQAKANQPVQPTIITIQADQQLNDKLGMLTTELADMKNELAKMQERFNRLATDTSTAIETGNKAVIDGVAADTQAKLNAQSKEMRGYIDQKTNPVRQNAPAIGMFCILTGAFLLWASRQYKLTEGSRKPREAVASRGKKSQKLFYESCGQKDGVKSHG